MKRPENMKWVIGSSVVFLLGSPNVALTVVDYEWHEVRKCWLVVVAWFDTQNQLQEARYEESAFQEWPRTRNAR